MGVIEIPKWAAVVWVTIDVLIIIGWLATILQSRSLLQRVARRRFDDLKFIRDKVGPEHFDRVMDIGPTSPLKRS